MALLEEIHTILMRVPYPATKEELIAAVREMGEPEAVVTQLQRLPEYRYGSVNSVMDALRAEE